MRIKANYPRPLLIVASFFAATSSITAQAPITINDTTQHTVKLLQDIVITGQYTPQSLRNSVYNVRVINQEQIRMRGATNILGVLNNELGIRLSTDYTLGETDVQLMGVGGQRLKVLLDGIPLIDRDATKQSIAQIDINQIERIEIVEGPMSTMYGTDALGGVINFITKKGNGRDGLSIAARIQEESVGTYYTPFTKNGIHNEHLNIGWQKNNWRLSAYGTRNNFGGYTDTVAYPAKMAKPKDQWLSGAVVGYANEQLNLWYRLDYLHEGLFAAGVMNINTSKGTDQYYITNRYTHQLQADWKVKKTLTINSALSYQDYRRDTKTYTIDYINKGKTVNTTDAGSWDVTSFHSSFFRSTAQWFICQGLTLQPGIEIKNDATNGQRIKQGAPSITDYSLFASGEIKPTDKISIRPGVRFSKNSQYNAPPVIPSINTKWTLGKTIDLRFSYARGFRAPILRELYFYFFDANHSIQGNSDLKAEYSNSYTASVSWNKTITNELQLTSVVSGFYNDYKNFIDLAQVTGSQVYSYINVDKYKTTGATLENKLHYRKLSASLGFSLVGRYNQLKENDGSLPEFTWSPEVNSTLLYSFTKLKGDIGLFYKFTGATPSYSINNAGIYLSKLSAYHWADLTLSKQVHSYIRLQAGIKNLFDVTRVNSTLQSSGAHSSGGPVLTGYGRSYFIGINFQWSGK